MFSFWVTNYIADLVELPAIRMFLSISVVLDFRLIWDCYSLSLYLFVYVLLDFHHWNFSLFFLLARGSVKLTFAPFGVQLHFCTTRQVLQVPQRWRFTVNIHSSDTTARPHPSLARLLRSSLTLAARSWAALAGSLEFAKNNRLSSIPRLIIWSRYAFIVYSSTHHRPRERMQDAVFLSTQDANVNCGSLGGAWRFWMWHSSGSPKLRSGFPLHS